MLRQGTVNKRMMFAYGLVASGSWAYGWTGMVVPLGIFFLTVMYNSVSGYQFRVRWRYNNNRY